jgi:hypothetical protein
MVPKRRKWWLFLEWFGSVVLGILPDTRAVNAVVSQLYYYVYNNTWANVRRPTRFNEKLIALKLSDEARTELRTTITDKELVKGFVSERIGADRVVPTLAILRTAQAVDAFTFPLPCVVKPTHSSQEVMFLTDSQPTSAERKLLKYWLGKSYFAANREPNYKGLEKKLIVEPLLGQAPGELEDVKVMCFHGVPKIVQVDHSRFSGHLRDFFDVSGQRLPISLRKANANLPFPYPEQLEEMVRLAAELSKPFSFIRVDFYVWRGRVLVGELTSFPSNCTRPFEPAPADLAVARFFDDPSLPFTMDAPSVPAPELATAA